MIGLDTNILVRYLTRDDEAQYQLAFALIAGSELLFITNVVLCELIWVLESKSYRFTRAEIISTLERMLRTPSFEFEQRSLIYQAIQKTQQGQADFSDYLIGVIHGNQGCRETVSFDRKLKGQPGFRLLGEQ
jgi:predicted nucleic-acid-binding protein